MKEVAAAIGMTSFSMRTPTSKPQSWTPVSSVGGSHGDSVPPHRQQDSRFKPLRWCVRMAEDHRAGGRDNRTRLLDATSPHDTSEQLA
jgi:hypothetical protein